VSAFHGVCDEVQPDVKGQPYCPHAGAGVKHGRVGGISCGLACSLNVSEHEEISIFMCGIIDST